MCVTRESNSQPRELKTTLNKKQSEDNKLHMREDQRLPAWTVNHHMRSWPLGEGIFHKARACGSLLEVHSVLKNWLSTVGAPAPPRFEGPNFDLKVETIFFQPREAWTLGPLVMSKSHGAREQQQQPEHPTLEANSAPTASLGTSRTEHGKRVPSLSTTFSQRPISKSSFGASGTSVALRALKSPLHIRKGKSRIEIWKNLKASSIPRRTTTFCPSKQVGTMNKIHAQCQTCSLEMCCRSVQEDAHFGAVTLLLLAKRLVWRILCFQSM